MALLQSTRSLGLENASVFVSGYYQRRLRRKAEQFSPDVSADSGKSSGFIATYVWHKSKSYAQRQALAVPVECAGRTFRFKNELLRQGK
jgi:hypothetical protein